MFELSGVNYEEVLEQGDSILVRVIGIILYVYMYIREASIYVYAPP